MPSSETCAALALHLIPGCGERSISKLYQRLGRFRAVFETSRSVLNRLLGASKARIVDQIIDQTYLAEAEQMIEAHRGASICITPYGTEGYPKQLLHLPNPPLLLYHSSSLDALNNRYILSVVGSRQTTPTGALFIKQFIQELTPYRPTLVSGLAYGTDIFAHRCALQAGLPTIAVLASGVDQIYPKAHRATAQQIGSRSGALLSEYPMGCVAKPAYFPIRNRIIAGLAEATAIIEAKAKSGALITAYWAEAYGKQLFALPGAFNNPYSAGCHQLLARHQAHILTSAADMAEFLGWSAPDSSKITARAERVDPLLKKHPPTPGQPAITQSILQLIAAAGGKIGQEKLAEQLQLALPDYQTQMHQLIVSGVVAYGPGPYYSLSRNSGER